MMHVLSVLAVAIFAAAAASDLACRRIPNGLVLGLAALGLLRVALAASAGAGAGALAADAAAAATLFAAGALAFRCGLLGGGDVKLLAAGALWTGTGQLYPYLFITALAGGLLGLCFVVRLRLPHPGGEVPARTSLPYGVAIAAGGILALPVV
jgi:prepilin peptidase CpaA